MAAVAGEGDGPTSLDTRSDPAVATIIGLWRQRQDLRRAENRLNLQCQAVCRRASGGDKETAGKLWAAILKGDGADAYPGLLAVLTPYRAAMEPLGKMAAVLERQLSKVAEALPLWAAWAKDVRGLGSGSLAGLVGEAAAMPGDYRSVSGLWKRFGLAVIGDTRQRRVSDPEQALLHGYVPERRAFAYVISTNLLRCQRAGDPYRAVYDTRKAYELARGLTKAHAHNRALRVMVKELLKEAWRADRRLSA